MTKIPKNTKKVKKVITNNKSKLTFKLILTKLKMNIIIKEMKQYRNIYIWGVYKI